MGTTNMILQERNRINGEVKKVANEPLPAKQAMVQPAKRKRQTSKQKKPSKPHTRRVRHSLPKTNRKKIEPLTLETVSNDCALEIFERMDIKALCTMAEIGGRFRPLAQHVFRLKHKTLDSTTFYDHNEREKSLALAERLFKYFGSEMSSMKLVVGMCDPGYICCCTSNDAHRFLQLMEQYCCSKLDTLSMTGVNIKNDLKEFRERLPSLKTLLLKKCDFYNYSLDVFTENLTTLRLDSVVFRNWNLSREIHGPLAVFIKNSRVLEEFSLIGSYSVPQSVYLSLYNSKKLKVLQLNENQNKTDGKFEKYMNKLGSMKNLQSLDFDFFGCRAFEIFRTFVANKVSIENLSLRYFAWDDQTVEQICQMQTIKVLKLEQVNSQHVIHLVEGLKELTEFSFVSRPCMAIDNIITMVQAAKRLQFLYMHIDNIKFSQDNYDTMLKIIKNRHEHLKLHIEFHSNKVLRIPHTEWRSDLLTIRQDQNVLTVVEFSVE